MNFIKAVCPVLPMILASAATGGQIHETVKAPSEQTSFSMERIAIANPLTVSGTVLSTLRKDKIIRSCVEDTQSSDTVPANWFVASEIHLNDPQEADLIVVPRELPDAPSPNRCLLGANTAPFWIFRKIENEYELVLNTNAHDLKVLATRSNGYRDIETWSSTASSRTILLFRFDGRRYQPHKTPRTSGP